MDERWKHPNKRDPYVEYIPENPCDCHYMVDSNDHLACVICGLTKKLGDDEWPWVGHPSIEQRFRMNMERLGTPYSLGVISLIGRYEIDEILSLCPTKETETKFLEELQLIKEDKRFWPSHITNKVKAWSGIGYETKFKRQKDSFFTLFFRAFGIGRRES
jgi:hypothetical protein